VLRPYGLASRLADYDRSEERRGPPWFRSGPSRDGPRPARARRGPAQNSTRPS